VTNFFAALSNFLDSKYGLIIVGFLVTTVGASVVNHRIQTLKSQNDQSFEIYKIRLTEAKAIQQKLLENSTARSFYLDQVFVQIANPAQNPPEKVDKYWDTHVEPTKDQWNKDLHFAHAQVNVLFSKTLADLLFVYKEGRSTPRDPVLEKLDERTYEATLPTTLHGAFVDAHATVYYLLRKCKEPGCPRNELVVLAEKQLHYLEWIHGCLSYRMSGELLRYPYGPKEERIVETPPQCVPGSRAWAGQAGQTEPH
jgi:hypothetical protein